ncbi:MAG: hypothetical protein QOC75_4116 [Pseudonocardiales bacterium]|nr:hypothetical protein [Pseudonocardiales bacterium]
MAAASERVLWGRHRPACITTRDVIGGLQENLTDIQALSAVTAEFRALAHTGLDGANAAMLERCARMNLARCGDPIPTWPMSSESAPQSSCFAATRALTTER